MSVFRRVFTLTIADSGTESNVIDLSSVDFPQKLALLIISPTLATTVTVHVATSSGGTFAPLTTGMPSADVVLPSAKALPITRLALGAIKVVSTGAVSGAKVFEVLAK